jgi:KaiC/GvpD/RAD55 family RecA-like ATPase
MNNLDRHGIVKAALMRSALKAKKAGANKVAFRCPRHDDSTASAWLGDHAWGCSACGFAEGLHTLADVLGVELPDDQQRGLTLAEYAERKYLTLAGLAKAGVVDTTGQYGEAMIAMPYRDATGALIRTKYRTKKGTFWGRDGEGTPLYGQDILAAMPDAPVLLVEGESDCQTGWQRGLCVVGLPGASQWKPEYAAMLEKRSVFVWQEPDQGGATMVGAVKAALPKAHVIRDVTYNGTLMKDLNELHIAVVESNENFAQVWQGICQAATPIGAEPPAVAFDSISGLTLESILESKMQPIEAVPTPLPLWNLCCGGGGGSIGLARGWYVTIGANTGTGKSLIGLNLAAHAAQHGEVVTFISLEMGRDELATRYLAIAGNQPVKELEQGPGFNAETYARAAMQVDRTRRETGGHLIVNRLPVSKIQDIVHAIRYHYEYAGCKYFLVDYIQLARAQGTESINDRIELISHKLREVVQTLNITLVSLSQFNRQTSANRQERPVAQGLMGASAIENDSHQVLLFDHSRFTRSGSTADTWLIIDKNRHGSVEDIPVRWNYRNLRLEPRQPNIDEQEKKHGSLTRYGRGL